MKKIFLAFAFITLLIVSSGAKSYADTKIVAIDSNTAQITETYPDAHGGTIQDSYPVSFADYIAALQKDLTVARNEAQRNNFIVQNNQGLIDQANAIQQQAILDAENDNPPDGGGGQ